MSFHSWAFLSNLHYKLMVTPEISLLYGFYYLCICTCNFSQRFLCSQLKKKKVLDSQTIISTKKGRKNQYLLRFRKKKLIKKPRYSENKQNFNKNNIWHSHWEGGFTNTYVMHRHTTGDNDHSQIYIWRFHKISVVILYSEIL